MRSLTTRRLVLICLALVVLIGCIVPEVFHDRYVDGTSTVRRNRLTGDVTREHFETSRTCFGSSPRSVFGD
jgi:hypothetical protein